VVFVGKGGKALMNKQEIAIVALLFVVLLGWGYMNRSGFMSEPVTPVQQESQEGQEVSGTNVPPAVVDATELGTVTAEPGKQVKKPAVVEPEAVTIRPEEDEKTILLSNDVAFVTVSSWGGVVVSTRLKDYRAELDEESGPIALDYSYQPVMSLDGLSGFSRNDAYELVVSDDERSVTATRSVGALSLVRTLTLGDGYVVTARDVFSNTSSEAAELSEHTVSAGTMKKIKMRTPSGRGFSYMGVDSLPSRGDANVIYWGKKGPAEDGASIALIEHFQPLGRQGGCAMFKGKLGEQLAKSVEFGSKDETDWVAVKNKFFVNILKPEDEASGMRVKARREYLEQEDENNPKTWAKAAVIEEVSASLVIPNKVMKPGESIAREYTCYMGPKKYAELKKLGGHQDKVMFRAWNGWGWFRWVCVALLTTLNWIYSIIPNYGVAIILLTVLVKILFWPIMHKNTESMKKMQALKPEIDALKAKHKDNPKKVQQEQMVLYKKHKVNPLASCLPMVVQMPVFIAMFTVIRKAVELRYSEFLWVADLSEPEGLLYGMIPFVGSLNILPLLMVASMVWQQKLTPSTGDSQQKQMMIMMPIMMLFFMYKMASGLTLYWTVSQVLSIVQLLRQKKKSDAEEALAAAAA
jgi:YidC/Oxa1 family membrane protein insertase